jgi:predicted dehydrogenase
VNSKFIRFAVCGYGHIGKRHASVIQADDGAELTAVIDFRTDLDIPAGIPFYSSLVTFLENDTSTDVVCICTPNGLHTSQAIQCLKRGKHVVIEKPMGLTKSSCEAVIHQSMQSNKQVFVVKQNRYSPPSVWLKNLAETKTLGEIFMVQINCYWNRDERYYRVPGQLTLEGNFENKTQTDIMKLRIAKGLHPWKGSIELDGGVLFTQFSHFIDIMYWVFGDIRNIKTNTTSFNHQETTAFADTGNSIFEFEKGGLGVINFSTSVWDKNMESSMTVIGSKGSLKIGGQYMNTVEYCHIENYDMPVLSETNQANSYGPYSGSAANHHLMIDNVIETLRGTGEITANALEGTKVVEIIERIYAASDKQV